MKYDFCITFGIILIVGIALVGVAILIALSTMPKEIILAAMSGGLL